MKHSPAVTTDAHTVDNSSLGTVRPDGIDIGDTARDHFTIVPNHQLRNHRLSWAEKGMLAYIQSHQRGYRLTIEQIIAEATDGERAVRTILAGLERAGYVQRHRERDPAGRLGRYRWRVNPAGGTQSGRDLHVDGKPAGQDQTALSTLDGPGWAAQDVEDHCKNTSASLEEDQRGEGETPPPRTIPTAKPPTYVGRCPAHAEHPKPPPCRPCGDARIAHHARTPAQPALITCRVHLIDHLPTAECRSCRADRLVGEAA
jgi:hypothetical protein